MYLFCRLTHDGSVIGRSRRVFHDDELEDGEGEKRRDAERYFLTAVRRQPEHRQWDGDHEQCRRHDVDDVIAELARDEDGEEGAWEGFSRMCVLLEVFQLRFRVVQLPLAVLRKFLNNLNFGMNVDLLHYC